MSVVGTVFGFFGLALAVYYGRRAEKRREPTFSVFLPAKIVVTDLAHLYPQFRISYGDKSVEGSPISVGRIHFWNSGTLPVLKNDVLTPYTLTLPSGFSLLDVDVALGRPEIGAKTEQIAGDQQDQIQITFDILEPNDRITLYVLYRGNPNLELDFKGSCVGSKSPKIANGKFLFFYPFFGLRAFSRLSPSILAGTVFGCLIMLPSLHLTPKLFAAEFFGTVTLSLILLFITSIIIRALIKRKIPPLDL